MAWVICEIHEYDTYNLLSRRNIASFLDKLQPCRALSPIDSMIKYVVRI